MQVRDAGRQAKAEDDARLHNRHGLYDPGRHVLPIHVTAEPEDVHSAMSASRQNVQHNLENTFPSLAYSTR